MSKPGKVLISIDMEGISGIVDWAEVDRNNSEYAFARKLMVGDLNAAVEGALAAGVKLGASGSISGMANLFAGRLAQVLAMGENDVALNSLIDTVLKFPVTPAIKSLVAHKYGAPQWHKTKPPLLPTTDEGIAELSTAYDAAGAP